MAENGEKGKRCRWLAVIIVIVALVAVLGIYKMKSSRTDADLILAISEQGFEGHFYGAGERDKVVITFSGSEGGSSASDTMAWYYAVVAERREESAGLWAGPFHALWI